MKTYLHISTRDEFFRIDIEKLVYFKADGNYTVFELTNKLKGTLGMNLSKVQQLLSEILKARASVFARIGRHTIINLTFVHYINIQRQVLILTNGENFAFRIPASKEALKKLKADYVNYIQRTAKATLSNKERQVERT